MAPRTVVTAAACLIGNELLSGKVAEANLVELARCLRALGVSLQRVTMIPDDVAGIAAEVSQLAATHDVVFTSGGVGPTHDDLTMDGVALAFGVRAVMHPELEGLLRAHYGASITEGHLRMALAPEGAELAVNDEVRWPTVVMKNVWVLPGVPEIFRMKLTVVRSALRGPTPFSSRAAFVALEESELKPLLDRIVAAHPTVELGSYPKFFDPSYRTKLTVDGRDGAAVEAAFGELVAGIPAEALRRTE